MHGRAGGLIQVSRRFWQAAPALLLTATILLSGCSHAYRVRVDAAVLTRDLAWEEELRGSGAALETEYRFRAGDGPPYPAVLQVFSFRELGRRSTESLLALTEATVDNATAREGITPDHSGDQEGTRTLANGLETHWFVREGTVTSTSTLFQQDVRVRIVGEVGYDGRSSSSVVAVGIAQVGIRQCTPIINTCSEEQADLRSWISMVGDAEGSVRGAVTRYGLIDHLVTHG